MTFLPVVERELRVISRSNRLYWGRFSAALMALALVAWFWIILGSPGSSAVKARQIFGSLSTFLFGYCLLLGTFITADTISEEKRDGTLGLLFLTDLKGYDVAFGKLAASSLRAVYALLAVLPVLSIPLLLGGLAGAEISRMALVLLNTLLLSLSVGLLVSSLSRHDRKAQFGSLTIMVAITAGVPALIAWLKHKLRFNIDNFWYGLSPAFSFSTAFDTGYKPRPEEFWLSIGMTHAMTWGAFILAAVMVRRVWQDRPASSATWRERLRTLKRGSPAIRGRYREGLLNINPYYWLAARDRWKPYYVLLFLLVCAFCWFLLWLENRRGMLAQEVFFGTGVVLHFGLKVWLASEAGRQFFEDRRNSAFELTLSTPLPIRDILEGQFLALLRQFGWAVGLVLLFDIIGMIVGARLRFGPDSEWILTWVAFMVVLVVDAITIATYGMWLGLSSRRSSRAAAQTVVNVLVLPWLILLGLLTYLSLARFHRLESYTFLVGAYFVISLAVDFFLFVRASGNLTRRFRELAIQQFDKPK